MSHIDKIEGRRADEVLEPVACADVVGQMRQQGVRFGLVEPNPVFHRRIDVNHHDVAPIGGGTVAARRPIDAEGWP